MKNLNLVCDNVGFDEEEELVFLNYLVMEKIEGRLLLLFFCLL